MDSQIETEVNTFMNKKLGGILPHLNKQQREIQWRKELKSMAWSMLNQLDNPNLKDPYEDYKEFIVAARVQERIIYELINTDDD